MDVLRCTSTYTANTPDTVLRLGGQDYLITGSPREERFGLEGQPRSWIKYAVDLTTARRKIVKLVFIEEFTLRVGSLSATCRRSPEKESAFLDAVRGNPRFMQGFSVKDSDDNLVRVLDLIPGQNFFNHVAALNMSHERYCDEVLPGIIEGLVCCIEAMAKVNRQGLYHGDIRNDHLLVDRRTGSLTWIDFDFDLDLKSHDVWCTGNVLNYAAGKGFHPFSTVKRHPEAYPRLESPLLPQDAMHMYSHQVANLRKLYPYLPQALNDVLMRFASNAEDPYQDLESLAKDLLLVFP